MGKRRRHQADQKADTRGGRFVGLPAVVMKSDAWRLGLTSFDRDVHLQILAEFNGYNNGKIVLSQRQIADGINSRNFHKIGRSIARQIEVGLLNISAESVWKERLAREYRLTYCSTSQPPFIVPATNDYLAWRKNDAEDASAEKGQSAEEASARSKMAAERASARFGQKPQKCVTDPIIPAEDASSLIVKPYEGSPKTKAEKGSKYDRVDFGAAVPNRSPTEKAA